MGHLIKQIKFISIKVEHRKNANILFYKISITVGMKINEIWKKIMLALKTVS